MNKNPIIDSETKSSPASGLKPELATALGSLEVHLEQELTRYRRTRNGIRQPKKVSSENHNTNPVLPVNNVNVTSAQNQTSVIQTNTIFSEHPGLETQPHEETSHLPGSVAEDTATTFTSPTPAPVATNSVSSIVPTKVEKDENETLVPTNSSTHPDDYLESSEALLRSLQEKQPKPEKPQSQNDSLLSPLGIGSMLLLLLASLTLGYVVFNPQTMPQWDVSKLKFFNFNLSSPFKAEKPDVADVNTSTIPEPNITPIAKYPNLAAREFPEVRDPNDVIGLKPKAKPTPTPTSTPLTPVAIATPKTPLKPPALPSITPKTTPSAANTVIKPSADGYYYLIVDNKGNDALAMAQQVVPDAYLSDGTKYIYLGALKTEAEVNKRLQELKAKGIKARVRQP
ncbi:hypothetical protein WJM97_16710 [Okeanomitos corallinicola TIOX110]|uniref:SPOR domain-containing protein n=1 Tax=Okeanomitos corallinicola TIOX110 TaxID=3133117 RepID=A0ABZ2UUB2_9CYAN